MKKVLFLAEAEEEMNEAALFYDTRSSGLGREFLSAIEKGIVEIVRQPEIYPVQRNGIRRRLVRRFPYGILFRDEGEHILVIAVMHLHRVPNYWRHRISEP
jgi:plasmid stabilization system protein ParE